MNKYLFICNPVLLLVLVSCGLNLCNQVEIYRETSPDKVVDVIITRNDCGATTSASNAIYIVPKEKVIKNQDPIFLADHVESISVKWVEPKLLLIQYDKARIFKFTNFWHSKDIDNFMYLVNIKEIQNK